MIFLMPTYVTSRTGRGLSAAACVQWGMSLHSPPCSQYALAQFFNYWTPLLTQLLGTLDICPRTCPSQNATLCTYLRWFAKPSGVRRSKSLLQLPISSRCMSVFLRFRMGCHSLPIVRVRRSGVPRHLWLCSYCASHSVGDERHFVFDCVALQPIRVMYLDLFGPAMVTMQQFMWQDNLVRVARFVFDCFALLQTLGGGQ